MVVSNVAPVVAACCMFHNICEIHFTTFNEDWLNGVTLDESSSEDPSTASRREEGSEDIADIRLALNDYCI